jgi:hypothetical protein
LRNRSRRIASIRPCLREKEEEGRQEGEKRGGGEGKKRRREEGRGKGGERKGKER